MCPEYRKLPCEKGGVLSMKLQSFLADSIEGYVRYRKVSGRTSYSYVKNVVLFDHFCAREYPGHKELTQEIVDRWCKQRETESTNSCVSRVYPVLDLFKYLKKRGKTRITLPKVPKSLPRTYIPHAFTHEELTRFFTACDNIKPRKGVLSTIQRIMLPVFFRLLYSSGMRTTEVIGLKCDDVCLESGIVSIKSGKGYDQHFVVLHDTMLSLIRIYNDRMSDILPNREYFFPTPDDRAHPPVWVTYHFKVLWKSCNSSKAIPYELRHNYAIENINSWNHQGFTIHDKLLALSKSMGHKKVESTMAYYSLTPGISDIIESADAEMYEFLIPDMEYEKD